MIIMRVIQLLGQKRDGFQEANVYFSNLCDTTFWEINLII